MLIKLLSKFIPDLDKKLESEYRMVTENRYDEVMLEMNTVYYIQRKDSITSWTTITVDFNSMEECLHYYSRLKEFLKNKKLTVTYLT